MLYLTFLCYTLNYLELVESIYWIASWKVQDKMEKYIFSFVSPNKVFRDLSAGLSGTFQLCIAFAAKFTFVLSVFSWNIKIQRWRQSKSKQADYHFRPFEVSLHH